MEIDGVVRKTRKARNIAGQAHMLTFTCFHKYPLLARDRTRLWLIESLIRARAKWKFQLWAYVIMPNHAHVILLPNKEAHDISAILKSIKQPVARRATEFLRKTNPAWLDKIKVTWPSGRVEHRFWQQGGGYDRNIIQERTAREMIQYVHDNPVRRGLVADAEDWIWSSARCYADMKDGLISVDKPAFWQHG